VLLNLGNGATYTAIKQIRDFLLKGHYHAAPYKTHGERREPGDFSLLIFGFTPLIIISSTIATDPALV
jgi:hypothetical protein